MRFSCARCGQRYSTVDEPGAGREYRVPCVACGAMLVLKGGEFPALPTAASGPGAAVGPAAASDASAEEPLRLALGPMVHDRAAPRRGAPAAARKVEPGAHRWTRVAAGAGVALATAGAALFLVLGGPASEAAPAPAPARPARIT